ncbi:hypothetical protein DHB64_14900 [Antarcticibacterium sp. W02-3]|nr:hypothetical protein [Antarcticibacterium sp. W02-3]
MQKGSKYIRELVVYSADKQKTENGKRKTENGKQKKVNRKQFPPPLIYLQPPITVYSIQHLRFNKLP